ncbi:acyltransferase [Kocuria arenosa]|uniref:acyltransferase n=1 Tax=Kocuria arenosa TaxID=3071446 RepID=UPI0034D6C422
MGPGSVVWAPRSLQIGNDVYLGKNVTVEVDGTIGDGVMLANGVGLVGRTDHDIHRVGSTVRMSPWVGDEPDRLSRPLTVGSDVWIGYGAIVLSGISIGDSAVVAAGAVVTADVAENTVVAGFPARPVGQRFPPDEYSEHWAELSRCGISRAPHEVGRS